MRRRITAALERLKAKPHSGKSLRGELEGLFSLRIGRMRAVYEVDAAEKVVIVHAIGARGDVYKS